MQFHRQCIGILIVTINSIDATVVPRRAVLGFSSNVQRKRSSSSSSSSSSSGSSTRFTAPSSSSSALSAATINARELFDGSFFSLETSEDDEEDSTEDHGDKMKGQVFDQSCGALEHASSSRVYNHRRWGTMMDRAANIGSISSTSSSSNSKVSFYSGRIEQKKSNNTAILPLAALIATLLVSRRGMWLHSLKSTLRLLSSLSSWYLTRLEITPLLTKCITGGIIAWIGDFGAQWFENRLLMNKLLLGQSKEGSSSSSSSGASSEKDVAVTSLLLRAGASDNAYQQYHQHQQPTPTPYLQHNQQKQHHHLLFSATTAPATAITPFSMNTYDFRRGLARFLECLLVSSPLMHYGYELFEYILPVVAGDGIYRSLAALSHVVADSVFLDGIFVCTGIIATGLLEGHSLRQHVLPNLRNVYVPTMKASVCTSSALIPLQFLSFRFLPVQLRVLSVNAVDLIWTGVVSFVSHSSSSSGGDGAVRD